LLYTSLSILKLVQLCSFSIYAMRYLELRLSMSLDSWWWHLLLRTRNASRCRWYIVRRYYVKPLTDYLVAITVH